MIEVGIKQAKTDFSRLFDKALHGEVVVISRNGKDCVQLIPYNPPVSALNGFGELREKLKDLPADHWSNPAYDEEVRRLITGDEDASAE